MSKTSAKLTELVLAQRQQFPINEDDLVWTVSTISKTSRYRNMRGQYEVSVRCPKTGYVGWAIRPDESAARAQALVRLYYARDYGLEATSA